MLPQLPVKSLFLVGAKGVPRSVQLGLAMTKVPGFKSGRKDTAPLDPAQERKHKSKNRTANKINSSSDGANNHSQTEAVALATS